MEPICTCHSFEFIPIDQQPRDFVADLDPSARARLLAACESVAAGFADGRPHGSRTILVGNARLSGLFVLQVTWPGAPEPQLRLLCMRKERRVLIARGYVQEDLGVPAGEIELAEGALLRAMGGQGEPRAEKAIR